MNPQEEEAIYKQQHEANVRNTEAQTSNQNYTQTQRAMMLQEQEKGMIKDQLDLSEELERIEHLLKGEVLTKDEVTGDYKWKSPEDSELILLSDYGIHLILNTITWYINKNTLLSNYEEDVILSKMEDFSTDLADTIFMEYEKVFSYPTFDDCKKVLEERIKTKTELRKFAIELTGETASEEKIRNELMDEIEGRIDKEIQKIKEQIIKNKLKRFMLLLRVIQDAVHSTYLRAWKGQERRTLRQHIHVSETQGGNQYKAQQAATGPFGWLGRR